MPKPVGKSFKNFPGRGNIFEYFNQRHFVYKAEAKEIDNEMSINTLDTVEPVNSIFQ